MGCIAHERFRAIDAALHSWANFDAHLARLLSAGLHDTGAIGENVNDPIRARTCLALGLPNHPG